MIEEIMELIRAAEPDQLRLVYVFVVHLLKK